MNKSESLKVIIISSILVLMSFLVGCEADESDKINKAQTCLNAAANAAAAQTCEGLLAGVNTPQANSIKCAVAFLVGGVTTARIADAFKKFDSNTTNQGASFMSALAFDNNTLATSAYNICLRSEDAGLIYLASIGRVGAAINTAAGLTAGTASNGDIDTALTNCAATPASCNPVVIGETVLTMSDAYCVGNNANTSICKDLDAAIAAGGGDPATIADQLFDILNK